MEELKKKNLDNIGFMVCLGVWLWLLFKMIFTQKNISILKLFLKSVHQNNLKILKKY
jgi:hypothetical protein